MVISDMLCVMQHFNLNFISFSSLILSCSITIIQHLRERKRLTNQNGICLVFKNIVNNSVNIGNHLVDGNVRMRCYRYLFTRVNSFVEALINMVCELKITSGSKKCVKIPW